MKHLIDSSLNGLLRATFSNMPDGVVVVDKKGRPSFFNPAAQRMLGASENNLRSNNWLAASGYFRADRVTPYSFDDSPLARSLAGQETKNEMIFVKNELRPSGGWISVNAKPLLDESGSIRGGVIVLRDITDCERSRRDARTIEWLSRALEQTADSVIITDLTGRIGYVNRAFELTTGFNREEVLGNTPKMLRSGLHGKEFYKKLWSEIGAGRPYRGTIVNRRKNGELYWSEQTITPLKDPEGKITHFVSVLKDITDLLKRKEREVELRLAREVQQSYYRANASVPGFDIAGVAHPADETGGDYFDFIDMPDGHLGVAIGDVSGHGISSALVMAETRAYLRSFASTCPDVGEILTRANRVLEADLENGRFVTLMLMSLDPHRRVIEYASAGHEPGYLLGESGNVEFVFQSTGMPLGISRDTRFFSSDKLELHSGQTILLLTDGVFDSMADTGTESLAVKAIEHVNRRRNETARVIAESLCRVCSFSSDNGLLQDDVTSVILKAI